MSLIQPYFHAFTASGVKNRDFISHPIVDLMGLVNQLFAVSYITQPTMMYQLVCISLNMKIE